MEGGKHHYSRQYIVKSVPAVNGMGGGEGKRGRDGIDWWYEFRGRGGHP